MTTQQELIQVLKAIAGLAHSFPRPSGQPDLCRLLMNIEGMAAAAIAKATQKTG